MNKFLNLSNREHGHLPARTFSRRLDASEDLVARLDVFRKLEKHTGFVTSLCFNTEGDILVSGAGDRAVILWDWESGKTKLSFNSGHKASVFQAKIMPYSNGRSIVTSAARELRHAQIDEQGRVTTKDLGLHVGACLPILAIQPGSPNIFYFCDQDGIVNQFDLRADLMRSSRTTDRRVFYSPPKRGQWDYNAIAIDPRNPNLLAVAGKDQYARLYDIRKYRSNNLNNPPINYFCPSHLIGGEKGKKQITGLVFSEQRELLVSYREEFIYLFTQDMGYGLEEPQPFLLPVKMTPQVFKAPSLRACNFFGPNCEYVVGSDFGRISIWRKRGGRLVRVIATDNYSVMPEVESHPHTMVLASCGLDHHVKIWNVA